MASKKKAPKVSHAGGGSSTTLSKRERGDVQDRWSYTKDRDGRFIVRDSNGNQVCAGVALEEDARLIAQAPKLFRELRDLVMSYPQFETGEEISGADMVEHLSESHGRWLALLEKVADKRFLIDEETRNYQNI